MATNIVQGKKVNLNISDCITIQVFDIGETEYLYGYDWIESFGIDRKRLSDKKSPYHLSRLSSSYKERTLLKDNILRVKVEGISNPYNALTKQEVVEVCDSLLKLGHANISYLLKYLILNKPSPDSEPLTSQVKHNKKITNSKPYVYFILDESSNKVKIGKSLDPDNRLRDLQTANPNQLKLLKYTRKIEEKATHLKFSQFRISGEWFDYSKPIQDYK